MNLQDQEEKKNLVTNLIQKKNDDKSAFVSETALTLLYRQAQILQDIPSSHPLANTSSHRTSIKMLLLNNIYKNERIRKKLENHYNKKDKERRTNKRTQTHTPRARPSKRAMLTPLVEGKV